MGDFRSEKIVGNQRQIVSCDENDDHVYVIVQNDEAVYRDLHGMTPTQARALAAALLEAAKVAEENEKNEQEKT